MRCVALPVSRRTTKVVVRQKTIDGERGHSRAPNRWPLAHKRSEAARRVVALKMVGPNMLKEKE
jgi:hypothetical protein